MEHRGDRICSLTTPGSTDDFSPSPTLALGLARAAEGGRPLYELVVPRREIIEDVNDAPLDATFLATRGTANAIDRLAELPNLQALWANPATPELFHACARAPALRALYVSHFKRISEISLSGAEKLEHLMLRWAPNLVDLDFLRELPNLRTVYLEDMKRIDLSTLPELPRVTGFHLGGGMWAPMKVDSLEPLLRMPNLRHLTLSNVRTLDGKLEAVSKLKKLKELNLPNFFELEEVARLAGALPGIVSNTLTPVYGLADRKYPASPPYLCEECGGTRRMMTGKPASYMCPECDRVKYKKRVARWEIARAAAGWPREG